MALRDDLTTWVGSINVPYDPLSPGDLGYVIDDRYDEIKNAEVGYLQIDETVDTPTVVYSGSPLEADVLSTLGSITEARISGIESDVSSNVSDISTNAGNISTNTSDIGVLQTTVSGHTTDINTNATAISDLTTELSASVEW